METTIPALAAWSDFYVIIGGASGALVGLQFVVIALVADIRGRSSPVTLSAFATPTVVHLAGGLLMAAVMAAPWRSLLHASMAIAICALGGFGYAVLVTRHALRQKEYKPVASDWFWFVIVPCCLYALLLVGALVLARSPHAALFMIGGAVVALLLVGVRNAWDSVTYLVTGAHTQKDQA